MLFFYRSVMINMVSLGLSTTMNLTSLVAALVLTLFSLRINCMALRIDLGETSNGITSSILATFVSKRSSKAGLHHSMPNCQPARYYNTINIVLDAPVSLFTSYRNGGKKSPTGCNSKKKKKKKKKKKRKKRKETEKEKKKKKKRKEKKIVSKI